MANVRNDNRHGLIINSAYAEPAQYWDYRGASSLSNGLRIKQRRPSVYLMPAQKGDDAEAVSKRVPIKNVDEIRRRVKQWREAGYEGASIVTKKLLEHWHDSEMRVHPFFFCQLEAIETLIWLAEAPERDKQGIEIDTDGGPFKRLCTKLCTGGGKTAVMAMLIAWQVINHASYPDDKKFTDHILVVSPNLTVKSRLAALLPGGPRVPPTGGVSRGVLGAATDCYTEFAIVPASLSHLMANAHVEVINWQMLHYDTNEALEKRRSIDKKKGQMTPKAFTNKVLPLWKESIIVINDEAHHAWRMNDNPNSRNNNAKSKRVRISSAEDEEATVWIEGLDRINSALGINCCYDFSATPFVPSGKGNRRESLFTWIVSDFSLNDGIESGIVKTPRIVVRDDALKGKYNRPQLFHIYAENDVRPSLSGEAKADVPLPQLVQNAYMLLAADYEETSKAWDKAGKKVPPVMISVCNRTETAARVEYAFLNKRIDLPDCLCTADATLHIDSKVLDAEGRDGDALREKADTIGQEGKAGEKYRHVVSVGMLSEGWDAKTVTHIMGLRAFSSQLLCEQVVGRGLRRTSYDTDENGMFYPEYVNIFGIPFMFLPHEDDGTGPTPPLPPKPVTEIKVKDNAEQYEITWPNVLRIDRVMGYPLAEGVQNIPPLSLDAASVILSAEMHSVVDGKANLSELTRIDLDKIMNCYRLQTVLFKTAGAMYDGLKDEWKTSASKTVVVGTLYKIAEAFIAGGGVDCNSALFADEKQKSAVLSVCCPKIVEHIIKNIKVQSTESVTVTVDKARPVCSTRDMSRWYTTRNVAIAQKCQISGLVCDSTWEDTTGYALDCNEHVVSWAKNDHLGFDIGYTLQGVRHRYRPDFLVKLDNGVTLVLETKGVEDDVARVKMQALKDWIDAVNSDGRWGKWSCAMSLNVKDVDGICNKASHL